MMHKRPLGDFPEEKELVPERLRRATAFVAQWGGWVGAITLYAWMTSLYPKIQDRPAWMGSAFIFCLFVAITGTLVRSRMRLTQTILAAFQAGVEIQRIRDEKNGHHRHE